MSKPTKAIWAAGRVRHNMMDAGSFRAGNVFTPAGIVDAYAQEGLTMLRYVIDGQEHTWSWDRCYSDRYIATLARRMTLEIVSEG